MEFLDEVVSKAQKAGKFICEKADATVDYVSLEYKASSIRGKLDSMYRDLGKLYFKFSQTDAEDCGELSDMIENIKELNIQLSSLNDEMGKFKNICPNCKATNPLKADYCSKCGSKLK